MNSSFSLNHPGAIYPILQIVLVQNSERGKEVNRKFCPPNSSNDLCLFFCLYPSSMVSWYLGLCYSGKSGWRARLVRTGGLCPPPSQGRPSLVGPPCLPGEKVWPVKHRPLLHPSCCLHSLASGLFWEPPFFLLLLLLLPPAEVSLHTGAEKASNLVSKKLFSFWQKIHETSPILRVSLAMFEENVSKGAGIQRRISGWRIWIRMDPMYCRIHAKSQIRILEPTCSSFGDSFKE